MLRAIRGGLNSFFVLALLGLLIASFAIWGIGDVFRTVSANDVAEVGDAKITAFDFNTEYQREIQRLQTQFDQAIDRDQAVQFGIPQSVLQRMVQRTMFDENARDLGLRTTDEKVALSVLETDAFLGLDGSFDKRVYDLTLDRLGMTATYFENNIRQDITRRQLFDALSVASPAPDRIANALVRFQAETREATLITVPASSYILVEGPEEGELEQLYEATINRYSTPEYRGAEILILRPQDFSDLEAVTQEDIEAEYEFQLEKFQIPERRKMLPISFPPNEEAKAREFFERLVAGESFAPLAEELTDFTAAELEIVEQTQEDMASDYNERIASSVFAVEANGYTEPMASPFGWHVFQVTEIIEGINRPLEEVRDALLQDVASREAEGAVADASIAVEDMLLAGASLSDIAEEIDVNLITIPAISRASLDPDGTLIETTPSISSLIGPIFSTLPEDEPIMENYGENGYRVIRVTDITEPQPKPYEDVADEVRSAWEAAELRRVAGEAVEQVIDRLKRGASPQWAADQVGGQVIETGAIRRNAAGQGGPVTAQLADLIFSLPEGGIDYETAGNGDGYVAVMVRSITPGDVENNPEDQARTANSVKNQLNDDIIGLYFADLQETYDVTLNDALLRQLLGIDEPASTLQ